MMDGRQVRPFFGVLMFDLGNYFAEFGNNPRVFVFTMHKVIVVFPNFEEFGPELRDDICCPG
jgi:hypothetical protein